MAVAAPYGKQIGMLHRALDRFDRGGADASEFDHWNGVLGNQLYRVHAIERMLGEVTAELGTVEREISEIGKVIRFLDGHTRLESKVDRLTERLAGLDSERRDWERRLAQVRADARGSQIRVVEALHGMLRQLCAEPAPVEGAAEGPMWLPTPVIGFRVWALRANGLTGSVRSWTSPEFVARCRRGQDLPHDDGTCSSIGHGCGVYGAKDVARLIDEFCLGRQTDFVVGAVEMSGKVVEHAHGYRCAVARTVSAVVVTDEACRLVEDPAELVELFAEPGRYEELGMELAEGPLDGEERSGLVIAALARYGGSS